MFIQESIIVYLSWGGVGQERCMYCLKWMCKMYMCIYGLLQQLVNECAVEEMYRAV